MDDARRQIGGEGEAPSLVGHDTRRDAALSQGEHRLDEVLAITDHPGGAHQVVLGTDTDGGVPGGLGLAVDPQRRGGLLLGVEGRGPVEGVLGGQVHQRQAVLDGRPGQVDRADRVGPPRQAAPLRSLRPIHVGPGRGIDDDVVASPVPGGHSGRVRDIHLGQVDAGGFEARLRQQGHERAPQLAVGAGDENPSAHPPFVVPGTGERGPLSLHRLGLVHWPSLPSRVRRIADVSPWA